VTDRRISRQSRQSLVREDVGDVTHFFLDMDLGRAGGDDLFARTSRPARFADVSLGRRRVVRHRSEPGALLSAMLQRIQPQIDEVGRVAMVEDAEDAAHAEEVTLIMTGKIQMCRGRRRRHSKTHNMFARPTPTTCKVRFTNLSW
jgi:hypothetical protein